MRLQKYMAYCGIGSRRKCEELIRKGRVYLNGKQVKEMGIRVDPDIDEVSLDRDQILRLENQKHYILFYKPRGTITTVNDPYGRETVLESMSWRGSRIYPVGRLDYETEGLLILTNDGEFAFGLTHPKHEIEKEYHCIVEGFPSSDAVNQFKQGVDIGGFITSPAKITLLDKQEKHSVFRLIIHEGKNRQVRRMFQAIGHPVIFLRRERIGDLRLGKLQVGEWRRLTDQEVKMLKTKALNGGKLQHG